MPIAENRDTAPEMMSGVVLIHVPVTEFSWITDKVLVHQHNNE